MKSDILNRLVLFSTLILSFTPAAAQTPDLKGKWLAAEIAGKQVIDGVQTTMEVKDDRINGQSGCNGYGANYRVKGEVITFAPAIATQMACDKPIMDQEQRFFDALTKVKKWKKDDFHLTYLDATGKSILKFIPMR